VKEDEKAPKTKVAAIRKQAVNMRSNLFFIVNPHKC
jgi:hypothetical protein